jgi:ribonuclease BN (tRNA processing enzyme)
MEYSCRCTVLFLMLALSGFSQQTKVVLLGTGTPNAEPERFGPSVAIVVNDKPYVVDCGAGVVRRAAKAGIRASDLSRLFITHLHSDHTLGYADFLLTPGVLERKETLQVYGPRGTTEMDKHIRAAYAQDYSIRIFGLEKGDSLAYRSTVTEIAPGIVYKDANVTVTAFRVDHGGWKEAFGYTFVTPDKVIVVSGDCTYSESILEQCQGCDVLIHEVYSEDGYSRRPAKWKTYHADFHTSSSQLAELASKAKPKLLVLYHQLIWDSTEEKLLKEVQSTYAGAVVSGKDLDEY